MKHKILVVDDEFSMRDSLSISLKGSGYEVETCGTAKEGISRASSDAFSAAIIDYKLPDMDGLKLLQELKDTLPDMPVIMITGYGSTETILSAMRLGAYSFIDKPVASQKLETELRNAIEAATNRRELEYLRSKDHSAQNIYWGKSKKMKELYDLIKKIASSEKTTTCLVTGENGSGKEIVVRTIHMLSSRRNNSFVAVNCPALSAGLLESELFGHEKGAFTGAASARKGRFEYAHTGTLLLDEISEVDLNLQAKLLRVLQERSFEKVGSSVTRKVDVLVIATTNKNLEEEIRKGKFREDLYYRLNVFPIHVPSLREHKEDITGLINTFLNTQNRVKYVSDDALEMLQGYDWPGNIRELKNIIERAVNLASGDRITASLISDWLNSPKKTELNSLEHLVGVPLYEIEKKLIVQNLKHFKGNKERAARALGITSRTLRNKLKEYNIALNND